MDAHDIMQWGAFCGACLAIWRLWLVSANAVASKIHTERDIADIKSRLAKHEDRDTRIYDRLGKIEGQLNEIQTAIAVNKAVKDIRGAAT